MSENSIRTRNALLALIIVVFAGYGFLKLLNGALLGTQQILLYLGGLGLFVSVNVVNKAWTGHWIYGTKNLRKVNALLLGVLWISSLNPAISAHMHGYTLYVLQAATLYLLLLGCLPEKGWLSRMLSAEQMPRYGWGDYPSQTREQWENKHHGSILGDTTQYPGVNRRNLALFNTEQRRDRDIRGE